MESVAPRLSSTMIPMFSSRTFWPSSPWHGLALVVDRERIVPGGMVDAQRAEHVRTFRKIALREVHDVVALLDHVAFGGVNLLALLVLQVETQPGNTRPALMRERAAAVFGIEVPGRDLPRGYGRLAFLGDGPSSCTTREESESFTKLISGASLVP